MGARQRGRLRRLREASAGSSAPPLERSDDPTNTSLPKHGWDADGDGDDDAKSGTSGDGDEDDTTCQTCDGTGVDNGEICGTCNGSGSQMKEAASVDKTCPTCKGDGKILGNQRDCPDCTGKGKVTAAKFAALTESEFGRDVADLRATDFVPASWQGDGLREATVRALSEKDYSTATRVAFAKSGKAIPIRNDKGDIVGGAYPIADGGDVDDAVHAFGRNPTPTVKAHIIKNAEKVGAADKIPDAWKGGSKESADVRERLAALEEALAKVAGQNAAIREAHPDHLNAQFSGMTRVTNSHGQPGYQVTLIREGLGNQVDGNWYTDAAIRDMCESGRAEGMQAYANHPDLEEEHTRPERDVRHLIGAHTDVRYVKEGDRGTAQAVFVPITTDDKHPTYGWVNTLAEAAARSPQSQPLVGWSLYGTSAGEEGTRPDGSEGRMVDLIMPTSGDMVTNAGAGGEFARRLMLESARRRRVPNDRKDQPMKMGEFRTQMAEALSKFREATSDEDHTAANAEIERLQTEAAKIDAPPQAPDSIEALTESAPALVASLRESAKSEAADELTRLREEAAQTAAKLKEAEKFIGGITEVRDLADAIREAGVTDPGEIKAYCQQARTLGLREAADIKDMVETDRAAQKAREDALMARLREATADLPLVEGIFERTPEGSGPSDGGAALLREAGLPVKTPAAA